MPIRSLAGGLAGAAAALALAAPQAQAQVAWAPCAPAGYECGSVTVPLDRSGTVPGTIPLSAKRIVASSNPTRSAVVPIAGGPGQAAVPLAPDFARVLAPAIATRDLLVFDQRGTGQSAALSCPSLRLEKGRAAVADCARHLGPARAFFRTPDTVEDIEALRQAAGYDKLVLYGVSYGTKAALDYAARYPTHVESLVLDSLVPPEGEDPFFRSSFAALPRVIGDLCGPSACRSITGNAYGDLATLASRLHQQTLTGRVVDGRGRRVKVRLGPSGLIQTLIGGDLNPALRAELPGSVRAALHGDRTPILRLRARAEGLGIGDQSADAVDQALYLDTVCEETSFPWPRGSTDVAQRLGAAVAAARTLPPEATKPFTGLDALRVGPAPLCVAWPEASPPPVPPAALPQVPTLILEGQSDMRTPLEDAQAVAGRIPGTQVVAVPHTGHSVLGTDMSDCSHTAVTTFFQGGAAAQCGPTRNLFPPTPRPPLSLAMVRPRAGVPGKPGRTVEALRLTINDARTELIGVAIGQNALPSRIGGLRSGYALVRRSGLTFRRMSYVPGVDVSGTYSPSGTSHLRVTGRSAAPGSVTITKGGSVRGRLGGRTVHTMFKMATPASAPHPALARVLRRIGLG
jgi:pimeloyl-ACP methyl ester carboxylesterase